MKRKTPSIDWKTDTETINDAQISYISKGVSYDNEHGICLFAGRRSDAPIPREFHYIFERDIDPAKDMTIRLQKRGCHMAGFSYLLNPKVAKDGSIAIRLPSSWIFPNQTVCSISLEPISRAIRLYSAIHHGREHRKSFVARWLDSTRNFRAVHVDTKATNTLLKGESRGKEKIFMRVFQKMLGSANILKAQQTLKKQSIMANQTG